MTVKPSLSKSIERETVDFVLVSNVDDEYKENRKIFENGLRKKGLKLFIHDIPDTCASDLRFTLVQAPLEVLLKYYDIFNFRMPLRNFEENEDKFMKSNRYGETRFVAVLFEFRDHVARFVEDIYYYFVRENLELKKKCELYAVFKKERSYLFDLKSEYFTRQTARFALVYQLLNYQKWSEDQLNDEKVTLELMLRNKIYLAAYPPHDGGIDEIDTQRYNLHQKWANLPLWVIEEPLDEIEQYLGVKYSFYFAWLGCYTRWLLIPAILGVITILYGIFTVSFDSLSRNVCNSNVTMCPACDYVCNFYKLSNDCIYVTVTYLFDNDSSPIFAFLMAIWTTLYIQIWKRKAAILNYKWGLYGISIDQIPKRAQYLAELHKHRGEKISYWRRRFPALVLSYGTILFFIVVIIIVTIAVAVYRLWIAATMHALDSSPFIKNFGYIIQMSSSAFLNLITISVLDKIYPSLAVHLNELELHRTQYEYERALIVKIYTFKFINSYSAILYIALFKGKFVGEPGNYNRMFGVRQEECEYGSCLTELSFQLAVIMMGKQIINLITNYAKPVLTYITEGKDDILKSDPISPFPAQCTADYELLDYDLTRNGLFDEYLVTVMQFGFVTLFVPAFPLAPLCALVVNIIKIRLDARKILFFYRRPIPVWFGGNDIWIQIMEFIGELSLLINGLIIAFTSTFIPRLVYLLHNGSDEGFLFASLSAFRVRDLEPQSLPNSTAYGSIKTCMYNHLQMVPMSGDDFQLKPMLWEILLARFVFVILYQNIVRGIKLLIKYWVPEKPQKLQNIITKENYRITNLIIDEERGRKSHSSALSSTSRNVEGPPSVRKSSMDILHDSLDTGLRRLKSDH